MAKLIDVGVAMEVATLLKQRKNLLLKKCTSKTESITNLKARIRVRNKLFSLTQNPIYIHF
jgi:hypothetical protein